VAGEAAPCVTRGGRRRYVVHDMLGHGTFGQVAKCSLEGGAEGQFFAVKVIKNRPAYYHQVRTA
jgi:dual specificity protein kinase YAK1